jgi:hypothetical protein
VMPDPDVAVVYEVLYDTPKGTACLKVHSYTKGAEQRGLQCQLGHRKPGESEQRLAPLSLKDALETEMRAAVLDGESIYLRLVDRDGHDLSATKIDEARWPRDAGPNTVQSVSYWLYAPQANTE